MLDFGLDEGRVPEITSKKRREQYISEKGTTYRKPKSSGSRPRGGREFTRRR